MKNPFLISLFLQITLFTIFCHADPAVQDSTPALELLPSEYIVLHDAEIITTGAVLMFKGNFTVSGRGIYGHFDLTTLDEAGIPIVTCSSQDVAYRRDRGATIKSITLHCAHSQNCRTVQIFFHEMRVQSDSGPCMRE